MAHTDSGLLLPFPAFTVDCGVKLEGGVAEFSVPFPEVPLVPEMGS